MTEPEALPDSLRPLWGRVERFRKSEDWRLARQYAEFSVFERWKATAPDDVDGRERLYALLGAIGELEASMQALVNEGYHATHERELQKLRELRNERDRDRGRARRDGVRTRS